MKYKVQFLGANGWYDMKSTTNGHKYKIDYFKSEAEAHKEALIANLEQAYRIVDKSVIAQWDIYSD